MAAKCKDCFKNCDKIVPDKCVEYTGESIPLLGICKGDTLYELEVIIIEKLQNILEGKEILLEDLDFTCPFMEDILNGEDKTLVNILQALIKANCTLKDLIKDIEDIVDPNFVFSTLCLDGVDQNSTSNEILQAVIVKLCSIDDAVNVIVNNNYVKQEDVCELVIKCIEDNNNPNNVAQYNTRMVPGVLYPYVGSLSNFDNTGKGISANGFDKIYLYNGLNGTKDARGRTLVGAIQNVPGGALDPEVDPSLPQNAGNNWALNQKFGLPSVTLSIPQIPSHTHPVIDPGHYHQFPGQKNTSHPTGGSHVEYRDPDTQNTYNAFTGITLGNTGNSQPHTNLQPSIATYFIIYIP